MRLAIRELFPRLSDPPSSAEAVRAASDAQDRAVVMRRKVAHARDAAIQSPLTSTLRKNAFLAPRRQRQAVRS